MCTSFYSTLQGLIRSSDQAYFSAASELHNVQMQALFTAYATSVKKVVEDDSAGDNVLMVRIESCY